MFLAFAAVSMLLGVDGGRSLPGDYNQIDPSTEVGGTDVGMNLNVEPTAVRRQVEFPQGYARVLPPM